MSCLVTLEPTATLSVAAGVAAREFDGEWVILDLNGGSYFGLDQVGGEVWSNLALGKTIGDTAAGLATRYGIDASRALADVLRLAEDLVARRLLTRVAVP